MTKRLRELEVDRTKKMRGPLQLWDRADGLFTGYKMALEDLAPVLEAAHSIALPTDHLPTCASCQKDLQELRDALTEINTEAEHG